MSRKKKENNSKIEAKAAENNVKDDVINEFINVTEVEEIIEKPLMVFSGVQQPKPIDAIHQQSIGSLVRMQNIETGQVRFFTQEEADIYIKFSKIWKK